MAAVEHDMLEEDDTFLTKVQKLPVSRLPFVSFAPTFSSSWRRCGGIVCAHRPLVRRQRADSARHYISS